MSYGIDARGNRRNQVTKPLDIHQSSPLAVQANILGCCTWRFWVPGISSTEAGFTNFVLATCHAQCGLPNHSLGILVWLPVVYEAKFCSILYDWLKENLRLCIPSNGTVEHSLVDWTTSLSMDKQ